ncbi:MAG: AtpZ/AtpI family protein [Bacteroidota bacterium]
MEQQNLNNSNSSNPQGRRQSLGKYAKYSAFAFQMIAVFVLLSLGGNWLDKKMEYQFPYFTLAGVFISLISIFYSLYSLVNKKEGGETQL